MSRSRTRNPKRTNTRTEKLKAVLARVGIPSYASASKETFLARATRPSASPGKGNRTYLVITNHIVDLLTKGVVPWRKPWMDGPATRSYRGYEYRGINKLLLSAVASVRGLRGSWLTFNQARKLGGKVKKGSKGFPVIFWKWLPKKDEDGNPTDGTFPICRYYTVFSLCQTEGIDDPEWLRDFDTSREPVEPIENAEKIWTDFQDKPLLNHGGDQAAYYPDNDQIVMPAREQFESAESYFGTLWHEAIHSTGHPKRLGRFSADRWAAFGSESYSKEELVAEMGAAFLAGEAGISTVGLLEASAAYIQGWIEALKGDPRMAVVAGAQAQKATDRVLGRTRQDSEKEGA